MSSGNLTADRRFAYALLLRKDGDAVAAAEILTQALELAPQWAEGHFTLGETLALAGLKDESAAAYRQYLTLDPTDSMGAAIKLALLRDGTLDLLPEAYIRRLFEEYAPRFDTALIDKLKYRGPAVLREMLDRVRPAGTFSRVFDLGCGTGLAGAALRDRAAWLGGVDLAPAMVKEATRKGVYDHLAAGDMVDALRNLAAPCDLIVAADVFTYMGNLAGVFAAVRDKLDGFFAFTVQRREGEGFKLEAEHRFSHSMRYLSGLAAETGFEVTAMENTVKRQEKGVDVPGLVVVLR